LFEVVKPPPTTLRMVFSIDDILASLHDGYLP
jgi:hypothetical protein